MEAKQYTLVRTEGEYAYLRDSDGEELFIALALLPMGADVGDTLTYENLEFTLN